MSGLAFFEKGQWHSSSLLLAVTRISSFKQQCQITYVQQDGKLALARAILQCTIDWH